MNKKLELKNFDIRSLKLNAKGNPSISWFDLTQTNDLLSVNSDSEPHEDLIENLDEFRVVIAETLGLLSGWDFARDNVKKNDEKLAEAIRSYNEQIQRCKISGVTITDKGVKISGSLICDGASVSITTPLVRFESDDNDLGLVVKSIVETLTVEVWKFIYGGKRGNDLFNQKEEDKSGLGTNNKMEVA